MKFSSTLPYKTRNTLILLTFVVVIVSVGGYFILFSFPKKIHKIEAQIKRLQQQITALEGIEVELATLQQQIHQEEVKLSNLDKQVVAEVTPATTYAYLNTILKYAGFLKFDLLYAGTKKVKEYGYNLYNLRGEGFFNNIYRFIWYIERGPQIYRVQKLNLRGVESKNPDTGESELLVPFELELTALYAEVKDLPPIKRELTDVVVSEVKNPFYPYITRDLPPNTEGLVEVERSELKAVIPGKAFIADQNGKVQVLREGDEVYLGYTTRIDTETGQVEFTLNKGGIVEKFVLKLRFEQAK
ncbi:MAG: hypothetical protein ONB05_05050 [candidate division KSB1 bacterium]|nr:hypothetical protein [candidate division KSB1 bacterium]